MRGGKSVSPSLQTSTNSRVAGTSNNSGTFLGVAAPIVSTGLAGSATMVEKVYDGISLSRAKAGRANMSLFWDVRQYGLQTSDPIILNLAKSIETNAVTSYRSSTKASVNSSNFGRAVLILSLFGTGLALIDSKIQSDSTGDPRYIYKTIATESSGYIGGFITGALTVSIAGAPETLGGSLIVGGACVGGGLLAQWGTGILFDFLAGEPGK